MTGEMSLTEALKIMEAPENVKLAFNKDLCSQRFSVQRHGKPSFNAEC